MTMAATSTPDAAVLRLMDQVRAAQAGAAPLAIRGGGTKEFYGGQPVGEPLVMAPVDGICHYDPTEMVITVRAGTPLAVVEEALAEKGQLSLIHI